MMCTKNGKMKKYQIEQNSKSWMTSRISNVVLFVVISEQLTTFLNFLRENNENLNKKNN